jgi:hypothetical protein
MSFLCKFCGQIWLHWSPDHKVVTESGQPHNCSQSHSNLRKQCVARAREYKKTEHRKLDDFALLSEISDKIRYWNTRLVDHTLVLEVIPKGMGREAT